MEIFPAQYSTLSSPALQIYIAGSYQLHVTGCEYLLRGVSDTYLIHTDKSKFIFKVYRSSHRSYNGIASEVELLNILKEQGAPVAWAVDDSKGNYIQQFNAPEGTRHGVLFIFAPGKNIYQPGEKELNTVGREMARLHNIASGIELRHERLVYDINSTLINPLKMLKPAFADFPEGYTFLEETAALVTVEMARFDTSKFSYGYCHYDLLPKNFHFDERGHITFFDFDFAGKGYLVNDLMSFFHQYFWMTYHKRITAEDAQKATDMVVAAYRQVRPLSDEELAAIPYLGFMFLVFYLGFQYENYDDMTNHFFNLRYLKERIELTRSYVAMYCAF